MKRITRMLATALVVVAVVGGLWYYRDHVASAASATTAQTYTEIVAAKQGSISTTISVVGQLEAVQSADLAFEHMSTTSKLQTLTVKAGSTVTTGQVLATIDATSYQAALDQAESALQAAEKNLAALTTEATDLEIAQADLTVAKAQLQVKQAQATLDDLTDPDLASLEAAVASAQNTLAKAQVDLQAQQASQT
jgi:multidrug efflux pump subunit AcrA (membrane-fusion protein)